MSRVLRSLVGLGLAGGTAFLSAPTLALADTNQSVSQGVGSAVLQNASYFGDLDPSTQVTVDIVMRTQNQNQLANYINQTVNPQSSNYHKYLSPAGFAKQFGGDPVAVYAIQAYLKAFGISTSVYKNNLVITANGTAGQFNKAFNIVLQSASYKGKRFHAPKSAPQLPSKLANSILCVLGLSNYSNFTSNAIKQSTLPGDSSSPTGPLSLSPSDLIKHYNVQPLYDKGATGAGQTIGIVTLANFDPANAYEFWKEQGITVNPNRINVENIDGGSGYDGNDETTLDVEQSGALAPQANINVYVAPNSDTGFLDAFSQAMSEDTAQQISVSWGESETLITLAVQQNAETPQYMNAFNELFMEGAAQGQSLFAAAGDEGAYDAARVVGANSGIPGTESLNVDTPADSPYITAAGGTTLPFHFHSNSTGVDVVNSQERAWGWDYLYHYFDARGFNDPTDWAGAYLAGGGGGFSQFFGTPDYQNGVSGVNKYTAIKQWVPNADASTLTRMTTPTVVTGKGSGRNVPDLSMDADPYTGYEILLDNAPGDPSQGYGYATYGGTSFVAPQLCGLSALINSADNTQVGFWNPQIYKFAESKNSPLHPLSTVGSTSDGDGGNDNGFFTGTPGTVYNQATGLGTPDVAALAQSFAGTSGRSH